MRIWEINENTPMNKCTMSIIYYGIIQLRLYDTLSFLQRKETKEIKRS